MPALRSISESGGGAQTPTSAVIGIGTVLAFGAMFGGALTIASRGIPLFEGRPTSYWLAYTALSILCVVFLVYAIRILRVKIHSLLLRRTRRAELSGSEIAEQYLLRKEIRERNRPVSGFGGPVPPRWTEYLNSPQ